jgi:putative sigma-54 modulation protein
MKTTFTARHFNPSEELHTYSEDAVQKFDQFFDRILNCDIVLEPSPDDDAPCKAELNVKVPKKLLNASAKATSYEHAVNEAIENISRQLKKYKDKHFANN